jgi:hypothetical protein
VGRRVAAVAVIALGAIFAFLPPQQPQRYDNDEFIYAHTVERMKHGSSYYRAAADSYREVGGRVETTRAFRPPTGFLLWRWIPTDLLWPAFVLAVAVATGLLMLPDTSAPLAVPVVTIYLLVLGRVSVEYLFVELWAVPLVAAAIWAAKRELWWLAASFGLLATAVRELAALILFGGLLEAVVRRKQWWPWAAAIAGGGILYGVHASLLAPYLAHRGTEEALVGTGSVGAALDMAGFQLPAHAVLGALLWGLALYNVVRTGRAFFLGPYALLPLLGLIAARPYWGSMVVPFLILWASEALVDLYGRARPRVAT